MSGTIDRRKFVRRISKVSLVVASSLAGISALRILIPGKSGAGRRSRLGSIKDYQFGTFTYVQSAELFVFRDYEGIRAVSARCTHLGCIIDRAADEFVCPCHGSCFDDEGKRKKGAAMRDLPWFELSLAPGGRLEADHSSVVGPDFKLLTT